MTHLFVETTNDRDPKLNSDALAIFRGVFGKNSLGTAKFSFERSSSVDGQYQLWIRVNPVEFITDMKMKAGRYTATSQSEEVEMMRKLLDRLKNKLTGGWEAVVRQVESGAWYIVMVKKVSTTNEALRILVREAVADLNGEHVPGLDDRIVDGYDLTSTDAYDIYDSIVDFVNIMIERSAGTSAGPTWESIGRKLTKHGEFETTEEMERWLDTQCRIARSARPGTPGENAWRIWRRVINEARRLIRETKLYHTRMRKGV